MADREAIRRSVLFDRPTLGLVVASLLVTPLLIFLPWTIALLFPMGIVLPLLILIVRRFGGSPVALNATLTWTMVSFALHLAIGSFIMYTDLVNYFGPDALLYHDRALDLTREWRGSDVMVPLSSGKEGFYYLLAGLYWLLGPHPISGLVINAACAASLIPISYFTTSRLFGEKSARLVPPLLTITPAFLIWPSQLLREAPILVLVAVMGASAVSLTAGLRLLPIASLVASLLLLFTFRSSVALLMAAGVLVGIALGLRRLWIGLSLQAVVFAVMLILIAGLGLGYSGFQLATQVDLGDVEAFRSATARDAGSSFGAAELSSLSEAVATLPIGLTRVVLGPFPWEVGLRQAPAIVDGMVMWALFIPFLVGLRDAWRSCGRRLLALLLPAALLAALLAVVIGNYGLLLRERTQMMVLLVPFFALGLQRLLGRLGAWEAERFPISALPEGSAWATRG